MSLDPRPGRRLMLVVSISCTLLIVAGTALAYLSFRQAGSRVIGSSELGCRVAAAEAYGDRLSLIRLLQALASDPSIISADGTTIDDRLRAVGGESFGFTGGLAWIDVGGMIRVSTKGSSGLAADGSWWREVVSARQWTTSHALTSVAFSGEVMVFAVPTFDASGVVNGVLAGGLGAIWLRRQATEHLRTLEDERYGRRDDLLVIDLCRSWDYADVRQAPGRGP
ncbi:MAG: cache domain-containing protein [Micromonosporaceae bacterium]|nr:cache domain-containing protein [Micromonosporaceae bacterium]